MTHSAANPTQNAVDATPPKKAFAFLKNLSMRDGLLSLLIAAGFILFLCVQFQPRWDTNDDVFMSMTAHGYGHAAYSSPKLIHSNVLWGHIVQGFPRIGNILGYSMATMFVLFLAAWCIHYSLLRLGTGWFTSTLCIFLIFARPVLFPQFTVNAGLLTLAAVIGLRAYARCRKMPLLIGATILAFLGCLIRSFEFILISAVALPLIPWKELRQKQVKIAVVTLCSAIAIAWGMDYRAYSGPEWQYYKAFYKSSLPYLAFDAASYLKERPDITARHQYSNNDLVMFSNWFFADKKMCDPQNLVGMLKELGPLPLQSSSVTLKNTLSGIEALASQILLPLLIGAGLLSLLSPKRRVALVWFLCVGSILGMGAAGRPGQLRVYIPLVSLMFLAPLVASSIYRLKLKWHAAFSIRAGFSLYPNGKALETGETARSLPMMEKPKEQAPSSVFSLSTRWICSPASVILLVACIANFWILTGEQRKSSLVIQRAKQEFKRWPRNGGIVCWGATFPYEYVFHVFAKERKMRRIPIYAFSWATFAPYSVSFLDEKNGRGFTRLLCSEQGVSINAPQSLIDYLNIYCREHFGADLCILESSHPNPKIQRMQWIRCKAVIPTVPPK